MDSRGMQHSAAARLRVVENGVGIGCSLSRSGWPCRLEADQLAIASTIVLRWPSTTSAPIRAAFLVWENRVVTRVVHVPYVVEQDEDGVWCASAQLRPGVGAVGDGPTAEAAVADLRDGLQALLAEVGPPDELTLTLDVA
jgi:hypothetical protein